MRKIRFIIVSGIEDRGELTPSLVAQLAAAFPDSETTVHNPELKRAAAGIGALAHALLRDVANQKKKALERKQYGVGDDQRLVFFGYDLGRSIIKQALVSAADGTRNRSVADATAAVFFLGVPDDGRDDAELEEHLIESFADSIHTTLSKVLSAQSSLATTLAALSQNFAAMSGAFRLFNISDANPTEFVLQDKLDPLAVEYFRSRQGQSDMWGLSKSEEGPTSVWICEKVRLATDDGNSSNDIRSRYHRFFREIARLGTRTFRIRPRLHLVTEEQPSMAWAKDKESYKQWRAESGTAFFVIRGKPGMGATTLMMDIVRDLTETGGTTSGTTGEATNHCFLSFDFGTQHPADKKVGYTMALALVRQVLAFRPGLFRQAVSLCEAITLQHCDSAEPLWVLLRTLIGHLYGIRVVIAIRDLGDTAATLVMGNLVALEGSNSRDILVIITGNTAGSHWHQQRQIKHQHAAKRLHTIDLDEEKNMIQAMRSLVERRVRQLLSTRSAWVGLQDHVTDKLWSGTDNYFWAMAKLHLLETECGGIFSTVAGMRERISDFPGTVEEFLREVVHELPASYNRYLTDALCWIRFAPRPMTPPELAVAVSFGPTGESRRKEQHSETAFESMSDFIPSDLVGDINRRTGEWLTMVDGRVSFANSALEDQLARFLIEEPEKVQRKLLITCFKYLTKARLYLAGEDPATMDTAQHDFLAYAALNWPNHANRLGAEVAHRVMDFLGSRENVEFWSALVERYGRRFDDSVFRSPLTVVAHFGLENCVGSALADAQDRHGSDPNRLANLLRDALETSIKEGHAGIAQQLYQVSGGSRGPPLLSLAASKGLSELVDRILSDNGRGPVSGTLASAEYSFEYSKAILKAAQGGHAKTVSVLLGHRGQFEHLGNETLSRALHLAARIGQKPLVRQLISQGARWKTFDSEGYNVLGIAIRSGFDDIIKLLVDELNGEKAGISDVKPASQTALHLAAENGHRSTSDYLIRLGASVGVTNAQGELPLHVAATAGFPDTVQLLLNISARRLSLPGSSLEATPDPNRTTPDPATPAATDHSSKQQAPQVESTALEIAARLGHLKILDLILKRDKEKITDTQSRQDNRLVLVKALQEAASAGMLEAAEMLLPRIDGKNPVDHSSGLTALHIASREAHVELVRLLAVSGKFDVNFQGKQGRTAIHLAAAAGSAAAVSALIEHGASVQAKSAGGDFAVHLAISNNRLEVVKVLHAATKKKDDICTQKNSEGVTALALAVAEGRASIVDAMLSAPTTTTGRKTDKDEPLAPTPSPHAARAREHGYPLHAAVEKGFIDTVRVLVKHGFRADLRDDMRADAPIHLAATKSLIAMMKPLLEGSQVDLSVTNASGQTALILAAAAGLDATCDAILDRAKPKAATLGQDIVDIADGDKSTALYHASKLGHKNIVQALLAAGARPDKRCAGGWRALHAACLVVRDIPSKDHAGIVTLLLNAGADRDATTDGGSTVLEIALEGDLVAAAKVLLDRGADPNNRKYMRTAISRNNRESMQLLVDAEISLPAMGDGVYFATIADRVDILEHLLSIGGETLDKVVDFDRILLVAVSQPSPKTVDLVLGDNHARKLSQSAISSVLQLAVADGVKLKISDSVVKKLLAMLTDADTVTGRYGTVLQAAAWAGRMDVAEALLARKASGINTVGGIWGSPLAAAVANNHLDMVQLLLEKGADPNAELGSLEAPALVAARKLNPQLLAKLLAYNAKPDVKDNFGRPLLCVAVRNFNLNTVQALLDEVQKNKDDPMWQRVLDATDSCGRTPLMMAVLRGYKPIANALLSAGADPDIPDFEGRTPLSHALSGMREGQVELAYTLLQRHAKPTITDCRGRGALYWACRRSNHSGIEDIVGSVLGAIQGTATEEGGGGGDLSSRLLCQMVLHGAVAGRNIDLFDRMLEEATHTLNLFRLINETDEDGWTAHYLVSCYEAEDFRMKLVEARLRGPYGEFDFLPPLQASGRPPKPVPPSGWHPKDHGPSLKISGEGNRTVSLGDNIPKLDNDFSPYTLARADHAMPGKGIFYFEVTIVKGAKAAQLSVGFCEDGFPLMGEMLGWSAGGWGIHGDDGIAFSGGSHKPYTKPFDTVPAKGDQPAKTCVIGCGINFDKQIAFFTRDGTPLGPAFHGIKGKLYPAIAVHAESPSCEASINFDKETFLFKEYEDEEKTIAPPPTPNKDNPDTSIVVGSGGSGGGGGGGGGGSSTSYVDFGGTTSSGGAARTSGVQDWYELWRPERFRVGTPTTRQGTTASAGSIGTNTRRSRVGRSDSELVAPVISRDYYNSSIWDIDRFGGHRGPGDRYVDARDGTSRVIVRDRVGDSRSRDDDEERYERYERDRNGRERYR